MNYVIAYDISDDKMRRKVFKILKDYGFWKQNSVFELDLNEKEIDKLKLEIKNKVDSKEDNVKFYPLCSSCDSKVVEIGKVTNDYKEQNLIIID